MTALAVWWTLLAAVITTAIVAIARVDHNRQVKAAMKRHPAGSGRS